jgi:16S rRNA (guanine527-N7)-methyltransferase
MSRSPDADPDPEDPAKAAPEEDQGFEESELQGDLAQLGGIDIEDLDEEDEGEEEDEDEPGENEKAETGAPAAEETPTSPVPAKTKKNDEEEPPGPDVPAPPMKALRDALEWAFEKEDVPAELLDRFAEHAHAMLDANRRVNLTAILDPKEVAAKHYLDSWRVTQMMSLMGRKVVDLGTGPGFPGLPIAMAEPHCKVVLIDSTKKKSDFNEELIARLKVKNAEAHWGRAEEYLEKNRVDVVLVRAVSSVRENVRTLRKVRHSLKDLIMLKGASWSREVRAGEREAERLGFKLDTVWEHELPEEMGKRAILVYRAPGAL